MSIDTPFDACKAFVWWVAVVVDHFSRAVVGFAVFSKQPASGPLSHDTNGDGAIDVVDLLNVLLAWGTNDPAADINGDGVVDMHELVEVILNWGPCPTVRSRPS